ncbi:geranylgeranyl pyrophosphate synthetase [Apiospora arundinis]
MEPLFRALYQETDPTTFDIWYGHEFEKVYTINELNESTGHYRRSPLHSAQSNEGGANSDAHDTQSDKPNAIIAAITSRQFTFTSSKLVVRKKGHTVPADSTLEIKTRAKKKPLDRHQRRGAAALVPPDAQAQGLNIVDDNVARYNLGVPADPVAFVFIFGRVARSGGGCRSRIQWGLDGPVQVAERERRTHEILKKLAALMRKISQQVKAHMVDGLW